MKIILLIGITLASMLILFPVFVIRHIYYWAQGKTVSY